MIAKVRLETISNLIQKDKMVEVKKLSELLKVSEKTIRLDLDLLEKANILRRVHGGAVLDTQQSNKFPKNLLREQNTYEKTIIATKAKSLLKENEVILLDDGSTSLALAKLLGDFKLTVLTNDVLIINELMYKANINLYVIGGSLKRDGESFVINGEDSIQFVKKYRVNKLFLGASTIDENHGLMIFYYGDRSTKRAFMASADEIICLLDSSKFNHTAFTHVANINEIHTIISDFQLAESEIKKYRDLGINVLIAEDPEK
ncbi:MAG: DeoR/GlpR family DNA-binding transcription regulator [Clostridiaceae bacterium]